MIFSAVQLADKLALTEWELQGPTLAFLTAATSSEMLTNVYKASPTDLRRLHEEVTSAMQEPQSSYTWCKLLSDRLFIWRSRSLNI